MKIFEKVKNLSKIKKLVLILFTTLLLASLLFRISFDIAYNQTIKQYLDITGR